MSRPPINPDKSLSGIALDPQTLERVVPESRRPDGTVRKQLKIRPGFTPQEDVKRFRGTRQAQLDANALPKGHIIGWAPPPTSTASSGASSGASALSKSAKKNAKRKEKREKEKTETEAVPDNWEDDDDTPAPSSSTAASTSKGNNNNNNTDTPPSTADKSKEKDEVGELSSQLEKLETKD